MEGDDLETRDFIAALVCQVDSSLDFGRNTADEVLGKRHYILPTILILFDDGDDFDLGAGGDEDEDCGVCGVSSKVGGRLI